MIGRIVLAATTLGISWAILWVALLFTGVTGGILCIAGLWVGIGGTWSALFGAD